MDTAVITDICKALSSPVRLEILKQLISGEKCACRLLESFDITQPTLSHHMRVLRDCRLVNDRKEDKWHYYSLNKNSLRQFEDFFSGLSAQIQENPDNCNGCCQTGGNEHE